MAATPPAAVGPDDKVSSQKLFQLGEVAGLRRSEERLHEPPMRGRVNRLTPLSGDPFVGPPNKLPRVVRLQVKNVGDSPVGVVECFAEQICRPFGGRQFRQQQPDRPIHLLLSFNRCVRAGAGVRRLGKPRSCGRLATPPGRLRDIDGEPDGRHRKKCGGTDDD